MVAQEFSMIVTAKWRGGREGGLVVAGVVEGTVRVGDRVAFVCGSAAVETEVLSIEVNRQRVERATDTEAALLVRDPDPLLMPTGLTLRAASTSDA